MVVLMNALRIVRPALISTVCPVLGMQFFRIHPAAGALPKSKVLRPISVQVNPD